MADTIGIIVPASNNPGYAEYAACIRKVAESAGFAALTCFAPAHPSHEEACVQELLDAGVSGICTMPVSVNAHALYEHLPVPVVLMGSRTTVPSLDYVVLDDYHAAFLVEERLSACSCKRIAFLSCAKTPGYSAIDRSNGLSRAVRRNPDLELDILQQDLPTESQEAAYDTVRQLMGQTVSPNAIVAQNDFLAYGALAALKDLGIRPGQDVAVMGFGNLPDSSLPEISLSSVTVVGKPMPERAFELLCYRLSGEPRRGRKSIILAPRLVFRESFRGEPL